MKLSCRRVWVGCWAIVGLIALGCGPSGPSRAHLQGTVTLAGQPIPADATASIIFEPSKTAEQGPPASALIVSGKYECPDAPVGPVTVFFNITQPSGPEYTTDRGITTRNATSLTPPKYAPGMSLEVTGDNAAQDFDLAP
jgi:hypothetical protein